MVATSLKVIVVPQVNSFTLLSNYSPLYCLFRIRKAQSQKMVFNPVCVKLRSHNIDRQHWLILMLDVVDSFSS